jgi:putative membrane protein
MSLIGVNKMKSKSSTVHLILLLIVLAVIIWSLIKPAGYLIWTLEASPALVALIVVIATYNKFRFTTLSYIIIAILPLIMFVGGHYTYGDVPLFSWIKDHFHLHRNHYDRFGHFLKGLLAIVIREILLRKTPLTRGPWLIGIILSISLSIAALYEIIEFIAAKIAKGSKLAKDFLGTQGDFWDSQWDMSLALVGSILALLLFSKLHDRFLNQD